MSKPKSDQVDLRAALDAMIEVTFEAVHGNAQHASRLVADSIDKNAEVDIGSELAAFWTRAGRVSARAVKAIQEFVDRMGPAPTATQAQPPPVTTASPAAVGGTGAYFCEDRQAFGPFRSADTVQPQALRRRGDPQPSITSDRITVTPASVTRNAADLQIKVDCGGMPRGIYTGTLRVGVDEYPYNIYLDPQ
ncbi:MAG TPA: hypothetical protein VHL55_03225 [Acidimicrobiia bacterium]|jgi:hypothetical protein|nr:hypothetical protein [Acidimicrobiia bacterium]